MANDQMNCFSCALVQRLEVGIAQPADIKLCACCMSNGKACNSKVIPTGMTVGKKSGVFEVYKKAVHSAHGQPRLFGNIACRETVSSLRKKAQQPQTPLDRSDVVRAFRADCHKVPLKFCRTCEPLPAANGISQ